MDIATLKAQGVVRAYPARTPMRAHFPFGLAQSGVHELAETCFGDMPALTGLALAARAEGGRANRAGAVFWVTEARPGLEHGCVPDNALRAFSAHHTPRLVVRPGKLSDALWTIEEAIASSAVSLIVAEISGADFTTTRRLALASGRHGVPVILLMPYGRQGATAAEARWRIASRPSAPNRYDPRAPGAPRWHATLERSRSAPHLAGHSFDLEWNNETLSLTVVSGLVTGQVAPPAPPRRGPADASGIRRAG
jgi:protein ImuA